MENLQRFIEAKDDDGVETIWTCCVTCLAHLAALCHLISQTEPTLRASMGEMCDLALGKLGDLSHEVPVEGRSYFNILTGVRILAVPLRRDNALTRGADQISWKKALDTIDIRIGLSSHARSRSLWHWREVIGKAYVEFQVNFLGYGPTPLISLALSVDGRTPDSRYPSLLLHQERERYGL